jgi:hypothetical protein
VVLQATANVPKKRSGVERKKIKSTGQDSMPEVLQLVATTEI